MLSHSVTGSYRDIEGQFLTNDHSLISHYGKVCEPARGERGQACANYMLADSHKVVAVVTSRYTTHIVLAIIELASDGHHEA